MVLQTGQEINELDNTGFCNGNLGANRFIVQVTADSVRLLHHTELVQEVNLDMLGAPVQEACVSDPTWPCWRRTASAWC